MRRAAVAVAAVVVLAGCGTSAATGAGTGTPVAPPSSSASVAVAEMQVDGTVQLARAHETTWNGKYSPCWSDGNEPYAFEGPGADPFSDVKKGAQVVVTDAAGKTVGVGKLRAGVAYSLRACSFPFTVTGVPGGSQFYGVAVAGQPPVQVTLEQMQTGPVVPLG